MRCGCNLNRAVDFFRRLVVVELLNSRSRNTSEMRRNVGRRLRHNSSRRGTSRARSSAGGSGAVRVDSGSGGTKGNCIELGRMTVTKHNGPVILDDVVTIVDPKPGPKSGAYKISGARAPTNRTSGRHGGRADELFLVFVPKLHCPSNISKTSEHEKAAMRRKNDTVATSSAEIENGARLAIKE